LIKDPARRSQTGGPRHALGKVYIGGEKKKKSYGLRKKKKKSYGIRKKKKN